MNDPSWMYRNSLKELYRQDHLQGVKSFINFALSNPKNISVGKIRCSCVKCKNKKFHYKDVVMIHLLKKKVHRGIFMLVGTRRTLSSLQDDVRKNDWLNF
jgi:hypothetical protein